MMRVMRTAMSNFPGTLWKPGAKVDTSCGAKAMPSRQTAPTMTMMAVATRLAR